MLELRNISVEIDDGGDEPKRLLDQVTAAWPAGCFCAVIGPSGCGKSTLVKTIAGMLEPVSGSLHWHGRNLDEDDFSVGELAYVPQFSIAHEPLTVLESARYTLRLRVAGLDGAQRKERIARVLDEVGLAPFADRQVKVLSGGQRRRLALALELLTNPALLLCDEVTSGLDPRSEDEIVRLLAELAHHGGGGGSRIVLSVTHSLKQLALYDAVTVLVQGRLAFHGPGDSLCGYFQIADPEEVYDRLADHPPAAWADQWASVTAASA